MQFANATKLPPDVHLMIENAPKYIPEFIKAGADYVTFHIETGENHEATCQMIRDLGAKPEL